MKALERRIGLRRDATRAPIQGPEWQGAAPRRPKTQTQDPAGPITYCGQKMVLTMGSTLAAWARSGLITRMPEPRRKRRHSSGPALASGWDDTFTIWVVTGSIWTTGSSRCPDRGYPTGHFRNANPAARHAGMEMAIRARTGTCNTRVRPRSIWPALKARVKSLCEQVGLGLARSVTKSIAATEDPAQILDAAVLSALSAKLEDTLRGVERLRRATGVVGQASFSRLCQQMNLAGDCLDDIPDRSALRQLIEALEKAAGAAPLRQNGAGQTTQVVDNGHAPADATNGLCNGRTSAQAKKPVPEDVKVLGAARADLIREAQRVGKLRNMKVSDVVDRAAKGAFRFTDLQRLTREALPALKAAIEILRQVA